MRYWSIVFWAWLVAIYPVSAGADVFIKRAYVRGMPPGHPVTAAFMRLVNDSAVDIVIDGGRSNAAEKVEFHQHVHRDGKMSMRQVPSITIPAKGEFVLEPGAYHLMLIGLKQPLHAGKTVDIQLLSGNTEIVNAELPVRSVLDEHQHH